MPPSQVDPVLTAYVRHVIIGIRNAEPTKLANELGLKPPTIVNIRDGTRGVGYASLQKIAQARFDGSIDRLKAAAREWAEKNPALLQVRQSLLLPVSAVRYDSREAAILTHVRYAERDETEIRAAADAVAVALHADEDPGERWWYEQIDAELKRKRPRLGVREITEDDVTSRRTGRNK